MRNAKKAANMLQLLTFIVSESDNTRRKCKLHQFYDYDLDSAAICRAIKIDTVVILWETKVDFVRYIAAST